ncbi:MAG: zf-HC2 domain-containing protein [Prolixibacteraceae bacterium]|jgi:anti-sigma factor RsiW|nr:zf-HC2 domain-containing protein [Prolixibacteraceae bacterium]
MNCKAIDKNLIFYIDGSLSADKNQMVSHHLKSCTECTAKLDYLTHSLQQFDAVKSTEIKPFLYTRISARMEQPKVTRTQWVLAPFAIAAVLVVGLFFGSLVGKITVAPRVTVAQVDYDVAYLFNDAQIENVEYKLLND